MTVELKTRIYDDVKSAMRARDKERLGVLRLITAAIKQREVDERIELNDTDVLQVLDKMVKQRRDSQAQFLDAGRDELAAQESFEIGILTEYLPPALSDDALKALVDAAVSESGAQSIKEMGKVMGLLRPQVQGRADMGAVSAAVKARLSEQT
jgi:uncharacterized protein YqeY